MPVIEFASEPGATFECRLAGLASPGTFTPCTSPRSYGPLTDDSYTFSVRATDAAGNVGQPVSTSFTIATQGPQTTISNGPPSLSNEAAPVFELTSSLPGATFECKLDDRPWVSCTSTFLAGVLADGVHMFSARASDGLGNVDQTPATRTFTIDTTPPDSEVQSGPSGPVHTGPLPFSVWATDGKLECALDDGDYGSCGIVLRADDLAVGEHVFRARATDKVGNVGQPAEWVFTVVNEAPIAKLDLDADTGVAPHTLHATVNGTDAENDRMTYELDFGDGQSASGALPSPAIAHRYEAAGTYTARLSIDDGRESGSAERTITVTVPQVLPAPPPPAPLSLTLSSPAVDLGTFIPGVARDYAGTLTATVGGPAARLHVADTSGSAPGYLVGLAGALPQPLQVRATNGAFAPLTSAVTIPTTIEFKQPIGAAETLKPGAYAKALTFTLSVTSP